MKKWLTAVPMILITLSCIGPKADPNFSLISIGMTKEQVKTCLGEPIRVAVQGATEYFEYDAWDSVGQLKINIRSLFVRFINGKVESYGKKGDFDSTKDPTQKILIQDKKDITTHATQDVKVDAHDFDLEKELKKLDGMVRSGLISQEEWAVLRKKVMEKALN